MGRRLKRVAAATAAFLATVCVVQSQEVNPVLIETRDGELVIRRGPGWCSENVTFTVQAREPRYLDGSEVDAQGRPTRVTLHRLLGGIQNMFNADCPIAKTVTLNGYVDDVHVYQGVSGADHAAGKWVLLSMPVILSSDAPAPVASPPQTAQVAAPPPPRRESLAECDALAGHPQDSTLKGAAGVSDDDIKPGPALQACEEAAQVEPNNPRIKFQHARTLIAYDKVGEGLDLMVEAAEAGHGAAVAVLGDVTLYGLVDESPDPATAKALYQKAAKLGFKPAAALAAAIEANPKEDTSQAQVATPQYHHPDRLAIATKGDVLPGSGGAFAQTLTYTAHVAAGIAHQCPERKPYGITTESFFRTLASRTGGGGNAFFIALAANEGAFAQLQQEGMDDGYALAVTAGCDSPQVLAAINSLTRTMQ